MNWPATLSALTESARQGHATAIVALSDLLTDCPAEERTAWLREMLAAPRVVFKPGPGVAYGSGGAMMTLEESLAWARDFAERSSLPTRGRVQALAEGPTFVHKQPDGSFLPSHGGVPTIDEARQQELANDLAASARRAAEAHPGRPLIDVLDEEGNDDWSAIRHRRREDESHVPPLP